MFDIGFSELVIIGIVALIVVGPERLPRVARTAGHLFGRLQRYVSDVKADISREMELDELRKLQASVQETARSIEQSVSKEISETETELNKIATGEPSPPPAAGQSDSDTTAQQPSEPALDRDTPATDKKG